jgi:tetratricopeptide (TPR) repeat protein
MKAKDYAAAVTAFESALKMAEAAGPEAADLQMNIETQLMNAYYRDGVSKYKGKKYDESIAQFDKGIAMAEQIGDSEMSEKLVVIKAKVLSSKGMSQIKKNDLDGAYATFDEAHKIKPNCVISYYGKGLVWKEKGDMDKMMNSMTKPLNWVWKNQKWVNMFNGPKTLPPKPCSQRQLRRSPKNTAPLQPNT